MKTKKNKKNKKKTNKKNNNYKQVRKKPAAALEKEFTLFLMDLSEYLFHNLERNDLYAKKLINLFTAPLHNVISNQTILNHIVTTHVTASLVATAAYHMSYLSDEAYDNLLSIITNLKVNVHGQLYLGQPKGKVKYKNEMESKIVNCITETVRVSLTNPEAIQQNREQYHDSIETTLLQTYGALPHLNSIAFAMETVLLMSSIAYRLGYLSRETIDSFTAFAADMGERTYVNGANPPADAD